MNKLDEDCKACKDPQIAKKIAKQRKDLITIVRNDGNLQGAVRREIIPKRRTKVDEDVTADTHIICRNCKSYFKKGYLYRHKKNCFARINSGDINDVARKQYVMESLIYVACEKNIVRF